MVSITFWVIFFNIFFLPLKKLWLREVEELAKKESHVFVDLE